jgi:hypothetical protein
VSSWGDSGVLRASLEQRDDFSGVHPVDRVCVLWGDAGLYEDSDLRRSVPLLETSGVMKVDAEVGEVLGFGADEPAPYLFWHWSSSSLSMLLASTTAGHVGVLLASAARQARIAGWVNATAGMRDLLRRDAGGGIRGDVNAAARPLTRR